MYRTAHATFRQAPFTQTSVRFTTRLLALGIAALAGCDGPSQPAAGTPNGTELVTETVAGGFDTIWDMVWAPDGSIWFTQRGGDVSRLDPASGVVTSIGHLTVAEIGEGGLMGMALHPDFPTQPWVYLATTYSSPAGTRNRVVRARVTGGALGAPEVLLDDIPGSSVHNGSRLVVGPDRLLYVTTGDASTGELAQNVASRAGKILRLTLEGANAGYAAGSPVFSWGHRNPQGLAFAPSGSLYETEHGPSDNDEVNILLPGRNYGWPTVHGMCDNDIGSGESAFCAANQVVEPVRSWTPTIAPSGAAYYDHTRIPGWKGSLLFTTLKGNSLHRLGFAADGRTITASESLFTGDFGRLRAVLVAPDGLVYIATSNRDGRGSPQPSDDRIIRIRPR